MDTPTSQACVSTEILPLSTGRFEVRPGRGGLFWDARFIVDASVLEGQGGVIRFAVALPEGETLVPTAAASPIYEGGRMTGLCISAVHERSVFATFAQPATIHTGTPFSLGAPVTAGSVVEIVDPAGMSGGGTLDVHAGERLFRHVGYVAPQGVTHELREAARELAGIKPDLNNIAVSPVFVRGEDVAAAGGLVGQVSEPPAQTEKSAIGIGVIFLVIVAALAFAAKRLRRQAMVERADALLAADIDRL